MDAVSLGLVLLGDSFPVSSLRAEDFEFRHRALKESFRLPVAFQAENDRVRMQVLPERFDASILKVDDVDIQAVGLQEMARTFLEYVGRRTVTAVGHNVGFKVAVAEPSQAALGRLMNKDAVDEILGSTGPVTSQLTFQFKRGAESQCRVLVASGSDDNSLGLDFNFHFDLLAEGLSASEAIDRFDESLANARDVASAIGKTISGVKA